MTIEKLPPDEFGYMWSLSSNCIPTAVHDT